MGNKRTWIKVRRGLLEPKHRQAMGKAVWLYLYMLDEADWDTGTIQGWKDHEHASALEMPKSTLTKQRQLLDETGYIDCLAGMQHQTIVIKRWINPREYTGEEYNTDEPGTQKWLTSEAGYPKMVNHPPSKVGTPTYNPHLITLNGDEPESQNDKRAAIEKYFCFITGLPVPRTTTTKQKKETGAMWWVPIREMLEDCDWDHHRTAELMDQVVKRMRADKLTIASPKSIKNLFTAEFAEQRTAPSQEPYRAEVHW